MKAFYITEPGSSGLRDLSEPFPQPGEVLLKTRIIGLCGTDLSTFRGKNPLVSYPRIPGHEIAARQMSRFGGMLSVQVRGGRDRAIQAAARVRLFTRATSLGGPHSLIEHRASVEGSQTKTPQNLLRMSVGLENAADLIADLEQALISV